MTHAQITDLSSANIATPSALSMAGFIGLYFGLRVCLTYLFFQSDPQTGAIVSFALNLLIILPVVFYTATPGTFALRDMRRIPTIRFVLAFLALSVISLVWSETSSRSIAFGYWAAMAADVILILLLVRTQPTPHVCEALLKGFVAGVLILSVIAWLAPSNSDLRLGNDDFLNPNAIGFECALAILICQWLSPQAARWKWIGVALALTLLRSLSKTSIIAFIIVEAFYLARTRSLSRAAKLAVTLAFAVAIAIFWQLFSDYFALYMNNGTQAETLTGRVGIWAVTLSMALQEPWLGHGLHSFRAVIPSFGGFEPWHAHNELLHQFFVYGMTGVILVIALYLSLLRQARRSVTSLGTFVRQLLLLVAIRGLADTERFDLSLPLWAITALAFALSAEPDSHREALS
jgi:exopolysaccharide production protein ExoQ